MSYTPEVAQGINDTLTVGQLLTANRSISTNGNILSVIGDLNSSTNISTPYFYTGGLTGTYAGYEGGKLGGTASHAVLDFYDNNNRIGEFYTDANSFNFFTNAAKTINFYTNASFTAPLIHGSANQRVGINNGTPGATLDVSGTVATNGGVQLTAFGAGSATFDAFGNLSSVSDERLKDIQGEYTIGLKQVLGINPILFKWNEKSGMETGGTYAGFSAQNIREVLGNEAIGENKDGYLSIQDRAIIASAINSIKSLHKTIIEQQSQINELNNRLDVLR